MSDRTPRQDAVLEQAAERFFPLVKGKRDDDPEMLFMGIALAMTVKEAYEAGRKDERDGVHA